MHTCPCCSNSLLRHVRHNSLYWYCSHCRQEMPDLESMMADFPRTPQLGELVTLSRWSSSLSTVRHLSAVS